MICCRSNARAIKDTRPKYIPSEPRHTHRDPTRSDQETKVRYLDIRGGNGLDEQQLAEWAKQAAAAPGWLA